MLICLQIWKKIPKQLNSIICTSKAFPNDIKGYSHIAAVYQTIGNYSKAIENYLVAESKRFFRYRNC